MTFPSCIFVPCPLGRSDSATGIRSYLFGHIYVRFIAERGASRLLEHVGQMDKMFKIPPPPGKTGDLSLRPLEENALSPLAPVSQPGLVYVSLPL